MQPIQNLLLNPLTGINLVLFHYLMIIFTCPLNVIQSLLIQIKQIDLSLQTLIIISLIFKWVMNLAHKIKGHETTVRLTYN